MIDICKWTRCFDGILKTYLWNSECKHVHLDNKWPSDTCYGCGRKISIDPKIKTLDGEL